MKTIILNNKTNQNKKISYIEIFNKLFWISENIDQKSLDLQRDYFWFTIYLLSNKNLSKAINLWIDNSKNIIEKQRNIFQIPHTYILFIYDFIIFIILFWFF